MKFIKTINSPVCATDLAEELEAVDINYELGDTGLYVTDEDYDSALDILQDLENEMR